AIAWRSDRSTAALRCPELQHFESPPRLAAKNSTAMWDVAAVLGDSLPAGRYDATLDVRAASGRVFRYANAGLYLDKSSQRPVLDYGMLKISATSQVSLDSAPVLETRIIARNPTTVPLEVDHGSCPVNVRLFRSVDRSGPPVWKSEFRRPYRSSV